MRWICLLCLAVGCGRSILEVDEGGGDPSSGDLAVGDPGVMADPGSAVDPRAAADPEPARLALLEIVPVPLPELPVGGRTWLSAVGTYSDGSSRVVTATVSWSSAAPAIASVANAPGDAGRVEALAEGSTIISAESDGVSAEAILVVRAAEVVALVVGPPVAAAPLGSTQRFYAIAALTDGSAPDVSALAAWSVVDAAVANVDAAGVAWGVGLGTTRIEARFGGVVAGAELQVGPPLLERVDLAPASLDLRSGETAQLTATGVYSDASSQDVTASAAWSSLSLSVASVSGGLVQALLPGSAQIIVAVGGRTGSAEVQVAASASCLELLQRGLSTADGLYWIDPDGAGPMPAADRYCDMSTEGGGWTRCYTAVSGGIGVSTWAMPGNSCFGTSLASGGELLVRGSAGSATYLIAHSTRIDSYQLWCTNSDWLRAVGVTRPPGSSTTNYWNTSLSACYIGGNNNNCGNVFYSWNHACGGSLTISSGQTCGSGCDFEQYALGDLWVFYR